MSGYVPSDAVLSALRAQYGNQAVPSMLGQLGSSNHQGQQSFAATWGALPAALAAQQSDLSMGALGTAAALGSAAGAALAKASPPPSPSAGASCEDEREELLRKKAELAKAATLLLQQQADGNKVSTPSQDGSSRLQKLREAQAKKEAEEKVEGERRRCHLHSKINNKCKFCQRHKDFVDKGKEEKAALREQFHEELRRVTQPKVADEEKPAVVRGRPLDLVNTKTYGFPPLLQSHIVESSHFKVVLKMETFEQVCDELYQYADGVEPYAIPNNIAPSCLFVCVYRFFDIGLDSGQLKRLLENTDSPYLRCAGILYVRYGLSPDQLWPWLGEHALDEEEFPPGQEFDWGSTIGEYVELLMTQDSYYKTVLPRIPVTIKGKLENRLAQVGQYRKRSQANQRLLHFFREKGARVEACPNDAEWLPGEVISLAEDVLSRPKVRIRFDAQGDNASWEQIVHLGKVVLLDSAGASGSRGSGAVDWSRDKGRSPDELIEDYRRRIKERAVCTTGKDYARRPVSFQVAMPLDHGSNSHALSRDETFVTSGTSGSKARGTRDRSRSPALADRRKEPSAEHQARMRALFEKYGMQRSVEDTRQNNDLDRPDVMRLG